MSFKIGFIINPIAGMGGRVGLKGTDGVLDEAIKRGAVPTAPEKAIEMLIEYVEKYSENIDILWMTCSNDMGENELKAAKIKNYQVLYESKDRVTSSYDTKKACELFFKNNVDLIVFCGGDGTARDLFKIVENKIPILGVPSGVKMHSGVFAINTLAAAKMLNEFTKKSLTIGDVEILDLDEDLYRKGEWKIRLFGIAKGIVEPTYIQVGKSTYESLSEDEVKDEISEHIIEEITKNNDYLFLFGPGGTIDYIANKMNLKNTLLGIDALYQNKTIGTDLNEKDILELIEKYPKVKLILSPIGAQGFILGRGNLQLSPKVIRKIGIKNIIIVSTPSKLLNTPIIRVDTGDKELDKDFSREELMMVVIGYRLRRVVKIEI